MAAISRVTFGAVGLNEAMINEFRSRLMLSSFEIRQIACSEGYGASFEWRLLLKVWRVATIYRAPELYNLKFRDSLLSEGQLRGAEQAARSFIGQRGYHARFNRLSAARRRTDSVS